MTRRQTTLAAREAAGSDVAATGPYEIRVGDAAVRRVDVSEADVREGRPVVVPGT